MNIAERAHRQVTWCASGVLAALLLCGCGGGNSTVTTITGGGASGDAVGPVAQLLEPTGPNTVEVLVDSGPPEAFGLGVANVPYVSVTVCRPDQPGRCATIDHVLLDTGSIGLRVLRSAVSALDLPAVPAAGIDAADGVAGQAAECYPFVLGGLWGPLAVADVVMGGERAPAVTVHLVDDLQPRQHAAPADCVAAADGELLTSVVSLQAKGVLGVGMVAYDCGAACVELPAPGQFAQYYRCGGAGCVPARRSAPQQVRNPVVHFEVNNNGTLIMLPPLPATGASLVRGRLVFGLGTQVNNQLPPSLQLQFVQTDTSRPDYLFVQGQLGAQVYADTYIDSGSNGLFFDDTTLPRQCALNPGATSPWYCPASPLELALVLRDADGSLAQAGLRLASADLLFSTSNVAFDNLGGWAAQAPGTLVLGLPFFYGRTVATAIWGQALATRGPWWGF